MAYEHEADFQRYDDVHRREVQEARAFLAKHTQLAVLEHVALKLDFVYNSGLLPLPQDAIGRSIQIVLSKLSNEVFSFCGALMAGSLYGGWHHLRAVTELSAVLFHIFDDPSATASRALQLADFERVAQWKVSRRLQARRVAGTITEVEKRLLSTFTDEADATCVASWLALYGKKSEDKLAEMTRWHTPMIKDLMLAMDDDGAQYSAYESMCHPTHVSSVGHRFVKAGGPTTLGFDPPYAVFAVNNMIMRTLTVIHQVGKGLAMDLSSHFQDELVVLEAYGIIPAVRS